MSKNLETTWRDAEARAQQIMADKDDAIQKIRDRYDTKLRDANTEAAQAQKAYLNEQAAEELRSRPDQDEAAKLAHALGLTL